MVQTVGILFKTRLIFPRINGPIVTLTRLTFNVFLECLQVCAMVFKMCRQSPAPIIRMLYFPKQNYK